MTESISDKIKQLQLNEVGLIDLRSSDEFQKLHVKGSSSLPWQRLPKSMHELPANHFSVALLGAKEQLKEAKHFLLGKGYSVHSSIVADHVFWQAISNEQMQDCGCSSVPLWQANPLLTEVIANVEQVVLGRTAVDIACGAGRDSVYLAKRGWHVTGIDHKADALERCQQLAEDSQTSLITKLINLENKSEPNINPLAGLTADLVLVMRYLHRPLFTAIDKLISPGGVIIYSTFMVGCEAFGSPKNPSFLLKSQELARVFSSYEILVNEQRSLADGRPVSLFVGCKPTV